MDDIDDDELSDDDFPEDEYALKLRFDEPETVHFVLRDDCIMVKDGSYLFSIGLSPSDLKRFHNLVLLAQQLEEDAELVWMHREFFITARQNYLEFETGIDAEDGSGDRVDYTIGFGFSLRRNALTDGSRYIAHAGRHEVYSHADYARFDHVSKRNVQGGYTQIGAPSTPHPRNTVGVGVDAESGEGGDSIDP